jgi:RHS repeat-associated protein
MNSSNAVCAKYSYDPFGNVVSVSGIVGLANRLRFSSKECDDTTGLIYFGHRYYDPSLQRWLNRDPIQESGGVNLFGFVGNSPINLQDSYGNEVSLWQPNGGGGWGPPIHFNPGNELIIGHPFDFPTIIGIGTPAGGGPRGDYAGGGGARGGGGSKSAGSKNVQKVDCNQLLADLQAANRKFEWNSAILSGMLDDQSYTIDLLKTASVAMKAGIVVLGATAGQVARSAYIQAAGRTVPFAASVGIDYVRSGALAGPGLAAGVNMLQVPGGALAQFVAKQIGSAAFSGSTLGALGGGGISQALHPIDPISGGIMKDFQKTIDSASSDVLGLYQNVKTLQSNYRKNCK